MSGSVGGRAGRRRRRWCVAGLCQQAPGPSRRRGAGAKGNTNKKSSGRDGGRPRAMYRMAAWHAGSVSNSLAQSAFEWRAADSPNCDSAAGPGASKSAAVVDKTSREGESLTIGVPTDSARSRPDGMGTVRAGEVAGARVVATVRGGRGRGTRGGVIVCQADGRGAPPGPKPQSTAGGSAPAAVAVLRRVRVEMRPKAARQSKVPSRSVAKGRTRPDP